jgi:hypothetical protein
MGASVNHPGSFFPVYGFSTISKITCVHTEPLFFYERRSRCVRSHLVNPMSLLREERCCFSVFSLVNTELLSLSRDTGVKRVGVFWSYHVCWQSRHTKPQQGQLFHRDRFADYYLFSYSVALARHPSRKRRSCSLILLLSTGVVNIRKIKNLELSTVVAAL